MVKTKERVAHQDQVDLVFPFAFFELESVPSDLGEKLVIWYCNFSHILIGLDSRLHYIAPETETIETLVKAGFQVTSVITIFFLI